MIREFKEFAFRGGLLDIAIGFVLGAAFTAMVQSVADDLLLQAIAAVFGKPDFTELTIQVGRGEILYGAFLTAVVSFLVVAWALFFLVKGINRLRRGETGQPPPEPSEDIVLLREIRDALVRT